MGVLDLGRCSAAGGVGAGAAGGGVLVEPSNVNSFDRFQAREAVHLGKLRLLFA